MKLAGQRKGVGGGCTLTRSLFVVVGFLIPPPRSLTLQVVAFSSWAHLGSKDGVLKDLTAAGVERAVLEEVLCSKDLWVDASPPLAERLFGSKGEEGGSRRGRQRRREGRGESGNTGMESKNG